MNRTILALGASCIAILAPLPAMALAQDPPVANESATTYREALDTLYLDMRAVWGELDRFQVRRSYCLPPDTPMKQPDIDELAALERRARELNDRYVRLRRGLNAFLANNPRIYAEFLVDDIDPRSNRWWQRHDRNRDRMMTELARKKAALAAAPERRCGQPSAEPAQPMTDPEPPYQPPAPPQLDPVTLTEPPVRFCSEQEKYDFLMNVFFPAAHQANRNAQEAQGYAYDLAVLVSNHTFDPRVRGPVEQAQAAWRPINAEQARIADVDIPALRARIDATPVVDCNRAEPTSDIPEVGSVPTTPRAQGLTPEDEGRIADATSLDGEFSDSHRYWVPHVGVGELEVRTQAGTGFQRPGGGGEIFAGRNANVIRMHTYGLVLAALAWRQWLLSGAVLYGEGDERNEGRVPDGTGIDTGFVYGDFSLGNSTGVAIADRGLDWNTQTAARTLNLKIKAVRAATGPLSWFLFADYLSSQRDYDSAAMAEVFGETLSQERQQEVSDDLIGGGVGLQFENRVDGRVLVGGWTSAGVFHRSSELEAWERNVCPLCGPADRDFTLRFDEKDNGVTWSVAAGAYAAFPLSQNVVVGVGADVAYIDEVGAVFNPSSGDQVFVDGLSTRLTTTDAVQYNFRLGVRLSF